jgi:hypothetical protein
VKGAKNKDNVCPAFEELVPLLGVDLLGRQVEKVQRHVTLCPRCGFVLRMFEKLLREEVTLEEKAVLDSVAQRRPDKKLRRSAKNLP